MPPRGVKKGTKRAHQYEQIKESARKRGTPTRRAEEIAARTVQKAKKLNISGRSSMSKTQLQRAVEAKKR
jgi:hypothetical protein